MASQNVTLSLPKDVLHRVKIAAARRGTSISRLLRTTLERIAEADDAYERAKRRSLASLRRPADLGTRGRRPVSRDELHER
jgi:hypothetical protein